MRVKGSACGFTTFRQLAASWSHYLTGRWVGARAMHGSRSSVAYDTRFLGYHSPSAWRPTTGQRWPTAGTAQLVRAPAQERR